jgi:hypothetical protein
MGLAVDIVEVGHVFSPVNHKCCMYRLALGPTHSVPGGRGVKRPAREADHSLPSCTEVKMGGTTPPLPQ